MITKEINLILKDESSVIFLKQESEKSFFDVILHSWVSIFSETHLSTRKKLDYLIFIENRIILIIRSRIYIDQIFEGIQAIEYNNLESTLKVIEEHRHFIIPLHKFRISYDESKIIRQKITEFMKKKNTSF